MRRNPFEETLQTNRDPFWTIEKVKTHGAAFEHDLINRDFCAQAAAKLPWQQARRVNRINDTIPEQFDILEYLEDAPLPPDLAACLDAIQSYLRPVLPQWQPNDITAQLYREGEIGIRTHRDYSYNHLLIVGLTLAGESEIGVEVVTNSGSRAWERVFLRPGDVFFLSATGLNDHLGGRIRHFVSAPLSGQRVALLMHQNTRLKPRG
jgi:hypothetical protein